MWWVTTIFTCTQLNNSNCLRSNNYVNTVYTLICNAYSVFLILAWYPRLKNVTTVFIVQKMPKVSIMFFLMYTPSIFIKFQLYHNFTSKLCSYVLSYVHPFHIYKVSTIPQLYFKVVFLCSFLCTPLPYL